MYISETKIRVRYSETDKMGYVYYGNYPAYYEVGRAEAMRELGMSYKQMEEDGIMMPIASMQIKYLRPAFYDDLLRVKTIVKEFPKSRMHFFYEVYNEQNKLLNHGETILAFVNMKTFRPCQPPQWFLQALEKKWNND
jgi:acyl-CoA thioester hydrolase